MILIIIIMKDIVAQSTAEAEFIAAVAAVNLATIWLKKLMHDIHIKQEDSVKVFVDNQATLSISLNPIFMGGLLNLRLKNIYHVLRKKQKEEKGGEV